MTDGAAARPDRTDSAERLSSGPTRIGRAEIAQRWAFQAAVLACAAVFVFWTFYTIDFVTAGGGDGASNPLARYFSFDPDTLSDAFASLSGINAAVFGIVITVVSIIVQLTADRYTGVARMFLRDRVNIIVAAYYVVACVVAVWLSATLRSEYVPRVTLAAVLSITTGGLVIMAPYFGYVFWFLEPRNIISRIRREAVERANIGAHAPDEEKCYVEQARTLFALEELTDITNNSIDGRDKIIASGAIDALKDFTLEYLKIKPDATAAWLSIGPNIRMNPDFVAMDPESLVDLEARRLWVEWKVMRQYLSIYNEALGAARDINYLIAIDTRYIGEAAAKSGDADLVGLVFRFMNSYLRSTLNAKDVRTAYNVLNQYRKLLESMLTAGEHQAACEGVKHMKYYGLVGFERGLDFVTETVAYDIAHLAQLAHELNSPAEQGILDEFLELDRAPFVRGHEKALLGVRKAQVKLAAYYLLVGEDKRAKSIADDMRGEPKERLLKIRHQLGAVENKDYWEIIDRGQNFEYMPAPQRACLPRFFEWLDVDGGDAPAST